MAGEFIPKSREEFLQLKGDLTEVVKLGFTSSAHKPNTGLYIYEKSGDTNRFYRKQPEYTLIDQITCNTEHLEFDKFLGVIPNGIEYELSLISEKHPNFQRIRSRLSEINHL